MKNKVLEMLKESGENFLSGQEISNRLGVSRTSIWKYINQIKEEGYGIESVTRKGYRIVSLPDRLSYEEISKYLNTKIIGRRVEYRQSVPSTNEEMKKVAYDNSEGLLIVTEEQLSGKGRLGRSWTSKKGKGIYMSILLKPEIYPQEATKITQITAAAVAVTLNNLGIDVGIKWPNDIILNGKKIAGILTEMSGELMKVDYVIVGLGMNVNNDIEDIPVDLREKASSINIELGGKVDRKKILAEILNNFEELYFDFLEKGQIESSLELCRRYSLVLGRDVRIVSKNSESIKHAVDISGDGELIVEDKNGKREKVFSGEISVRGIDGYI